MSAPTEAPIAIAPDVVTVSPEDATTTTTRAMNGAPALVAAPSDAFSGEEGASERVLARRPILLPLLPVKTLRAFPKHVAGGRVYYRGTGELLKAPYGRDSHFAAYSAPEIVDGDGNTRRLCVELFRAPEHVDKIPPDGVRMVVAIFDLDFAPAHKATAVGSDSVVTIDVWWSIEKTKITTLLVEHPGAFVFRGRGGYKIVYAIPIYTIRTAADAEGWTATYLSWVAYLSRRFGIVADPGCADWTHLFRLPFVVRDGVPLEYETIGDPFALGIFAPEIAREDVAVAATLRRRTSVASRRRNSEAREKQFSPLSDGRGVLFHAFAARGWIGREIEPEKWPCVCPNESAHTRGVRFDTSTVLYAPGDDEVYGWLHCAHAHCTRLGLRDVLACFSEQEIEAACAVAGAPSRSSAASAAMQPTHVARADFGEALKLLNEGATDDDIVARLRTASVATFATSEDAEVYFTRTIENAGRVHESKFVAAIIVRADIRRYANDPTRTPCAIARLVLERVDTAVLLTARLVAPTRGYENHPRREREWNAIGSPDAERIATNDLRHLREVVLGRVVRVAVDGERVVSVNRSNLPSIRDDIEELMSKIGDEALGTNCRTWLSAEPDGVFAAHARLTEILSERRHRVNQEETMNVSSEWTTAEQECIEIAWRKQFHETAETGSAAIVTCPCNGTQLTIQALPEEVFDFACDSCGRSASISVPL